MTNPPYILTIFSNPQDGQPRHLAYLDQEKEALYKMISDTVKKPPIVIPIQLVDEKNKHLDSLEISKIIDDYKSWLTIVHYSGHAEEVLLSFNKEDLRSENFITLISKCDNVKLVVLNGCSTEGFVKKLFERTNVRAVIATNNPVKDDRAKDFSLEFYTQLLNKETVAVSFTRALAALNKYGEDANIYKVNLENKAITGLDLLDNDLKEGVRGIKKRNAPALQNDEEVASWGIYTKVSDVLDWNLFESNTDSEKRITELKKIIRQKTANIAALEIKQEDTKLFIELLQEKPNSADKIATQQLTLTGIEAEIKKLQSEIELLVDNGRQITEEININERIQKFSDSVIDLNYKDQNECISKLRARNKLNRYSCFILHGDTKSCLPLLSRRFPNLLSINAKNKITFDSSSTSKPNFWDELQNKTLGKKSSNDPDEIAKLIAGQKYDPTDNSKNHLLFIFRNSLTETSASDLFNDMVFNFWKQFITSFEKVDDKKIYKQGIFAVIIDDKCEIIQVNKQYKSSREEYYSSLYSGDEKIKPTFYMVPVVRNLKAKEIWDWQLSKSIAEYQFEMEELKTIVKKTKGVFLDTVEELCTKGINDEASKKKVIRDVKVNITNLI